MKQIFTIILIAFHFSLFAQFTDTIRLTVNNPIVNAESRLNQGTPISEFSARDIEERGYDNLEELLNSVQGVYITNDGVYTQVGMRGINPTDDNNQRVLILVDNMPLNNPLSGQSSLGYDLRGLNMEDIKRVKVIRSPSTVMYGNNAYIGAIIIQTIRDKGLRFNFDTGSFGELDAGFNLGRQYGKAVFNLRGRFGQLNNQEYYTPNNTFLNENKNSFTGVGLKFGYLNLTANASYNRRKSQIPITTSEEFQIFPEQGIDGLAYYRNLIDTTSTFSQSSFNLDVNYVHRIKRQIVNVHFYLNNTRSNRELYYQDTEYTIDSILDPFDSTVTPILIEPTYIQFLEQPNQRALMMGLEVQQLFNYGQDNFLLISNEVRAMPISNYQQNNELYLHFDGANYNTSNFQQDILDYVDTLNAQNAFQKYFSYWSYALSAQHYYKLNNNLFLKSGARLEFNSITGLAFAPRLSLEYSPSYRTEVGINFNRGYRVPSLIESEISQARLPEANPNLSNEYINSFDITWTEYISNALQFKFSTYYLELDNTIDKVKKTSQYQNLDLFRTLGLEGGLNVDLPKGIKSFFNYNFNFGQKTLLNVPQPMCKFGVNLPFLKHFNFYTEGLYEGSRTARSGVETLPYFLWNANLMFQPDVFSVGSLYKYFKKVNFSIRGFNLLNQFYQHPTSIQPINPLMTQNGRTWQAQLTLEFY